MRKIQDIAREIFGSKVMIHIFFIFFVFLLFLLMAIIIGLPLSRTFRQFVFCGFILMCIYGGRWNSRRWFLSNKLMHMAFYSATTIIVLNIIGIIGVKLISNSLSLVVVITISGFVIIFFSLGILLSIGRATIIRQIRDAGIAQQQRDSELQILRSYALEKKELVSGSNEDNYLFIKADGKIFKINHAELLYAEAQGNYTKIVMVNKEIRPGISFTNLEKMLPVSHFARVHLSFIVNTTKIDHIEGNRLFINKFEIAIGANYREGFLKSLGI